VVSFGLGLGSVAQAEVRLDTRAGAGYDWPGGATATFGLALGIQCTDEDTPHQLWAAVAVDGALASLATAGEVEADIHLGGAVYVLAMVGAAMRFDEQRRFAFRAGAGLRLARGRFSFAVVPAALDLVPTTIRDGITRKPGITSTHLRMYVSFGFTF
jgi:hypothetical protein